MKTTFNSRYFLFIALLLSFAVPLAGRYISTPIDNTYTDIALGITGFSIALIVCLFINETNRTIRLHAEQLVREAYWQETINSLEEGVLTTDMRGIIRTMNPSAERLTGWKNDEAVGKPLENIYVVANEETGQPIEHIVKRILRESKSVAFENNTILRKKNAQEIIISNNGSPIRDVAGNIVGAVLVFRNITESKRSEENLRKSEAFNKSVLNSLSSHTAVVDSHGIIVAASESWKRFALENGDIMLKNMVTGTNYFDVCQKASEAGDETTSEIMAGIMSVLDEKKTDFYLEYPYHSPNEIRWFGMRVTKFESDGSMVVIERQNITAIKLAEQERERILYDLIQRNKNMEQFSYIVSHNLRSPLANILGFTELLKHKNSNPDDIIEVMKGMSAAAYKLDDVVKDLNNILQIRTQVFENREYVYFHDIVKDISFSIDNVIKSQNVIIHTDFKSVDKILSVKRYIHSIFYNLIYNSIKYQRPGEDILIELKSRQTAKGIALIFKDNGLGIDLEKNGEKLFGLYKRFHLNTEGKGMGLFMVKTQVETLGGKISATSQVNKGTEFTIEFENNN